jgi:hypothetical protein
MLAESASLSLVGARTVVEVFVELTARDDHSWFNIDPELTPAPGVFGKQTFDFPDLRAPSSIGN